MFGFGSSSSSSSTPESASPVDASKKEQIMNALRSEVMQANAALLVENMNNKCYTACIPQPGAAISNSEKTCLANCQERFMDAFNIVSRSYHARLSKERMESLSVDTQSL
ncbi:hypothetical protein CYLTODRAFT_421282 [Cylindrobasidium torrendii FP15055 ss-10]|uniref:Mitochondrial import inner membrane translocase subunit n=1 Tax=Cylindrobasidium torrendii FP15055 ss-10 TaxID=1314674 RepID=A0A0D7BFC7_9AGAR|nr:hypothetical protein CYLTODRAFT_421282 [Cylindrobasidium torrendii FP15055 ss-10]